MWFAYRSGKNRIPSKVWLELESAEQRAGITPHDHGTTEHSVAGNTESFANAKESEISESPQHTLVEMIRTANDEASMRQFMETLAARADELERVLLKIANDQESIAAALKKLIENEERKSNR
jgi:hypothetical protein